MKKLNLFGAQDMTVGNPYANLIAFALPLLIGNVMQQLYNTVDSIVVGRYIGDNALAAVGAAGPVMNLIFVLFIGIATGTGITVAQYFGAKMREELSKSVGTALVLSFIASIIIMVVGTAIVRPLLTLIKTPVEIYEMAAQYLTICFLGTIGSMYYNMVSGILRGLGDSTSPLVFLIIACGLNIILDLLFVAKLRMGVPGVAWATIISQAVSSVFCVVRLLTMKNVVDINRSTLKMDRKLSGQIIRLGLPSGLTQAIFACASIVVQSLTNSFGNVVIACSVVVMRVDGFAMMPNFSFGNAMSTYAGQNVGARRMDRVDKGIRAGMILSVGCAVVLTLCILLFGRNLMRLFTETDELVEMGMHMMKIIAVGYIAMAVTQCLSGVMRGAGDTVTPMWISVITTIIIRMPLAYLWAYLTRSEALPNGTPDSLFISLLVSWLLGAIITAVLFKVGKWRTKGLVEDKQEEAA